MKKVIISIAAVLVAFAANAQTNLQTFYDFGRDYVTTTVEMFKGDEYGDTFFFIDHYFGQKDQGRSAINGTYFEIERGLNFWQDTKLKDLSAHVEYDGGSFGSSIFSLGAKYFLHSADFSKTFTAYVMYDKHFGAGTADIPVKFSGVWGLNDIFGLKGLVFKGFFDFWGNNGLYADLSTTKFSFLAEPQLWYAVGKHLNLGTEIELSNNFLGHKGFMVNPCLGTKWNF